MNNTKTIIIDTETISLKDKLIYDLGFTIDGKNNKAFLINETIESEIYNNRHFHKDYSKEKEYCKVSFKEAVNALLNAIDENTLVYAYNSPFDKQALIYTCKAYDLQDELTQISKLHIIDILGITKRYFKINEIEHMLVKCNQGKIQGAYKVENVLRYITNNNCYQEKHIGLSDALDEYKIYCYVNKVFTSNSQTKTEPTEKKEENNKMKSNIKTITLSNYFNYEDDKVNATRIRKIEKVINNGDFCLSTFMIEHAFKSTDTASHLLFELLSSGLFKYVKETIHIDSKKYKHNYRMPNKRKMFEYAKEHYRYNNYYNHYKFITSLEDEKPYTILELEVLGAQYEINKQSISNYLDTMYKGKTYVEDYQETKLYKVFRKKNPNDKILIVISSEKDFYKLNEEKDEEEEEE